MRQNKTKNSKDLRNYYIIIILKSAVDWESVASHLYFLSADYVKDVGSYTSELIDYLVDDLGTKSENIHVIGHSLGAHAAGFASALAETGRVSRITGFRILLL